jgi:LPXTG-motif cell wall-anchored protein
VAPHRPPGGDPDAPDARQQPDICDQAAAQGIECRSTRGDEKLMIAASVGLLVLLVLWGVLAWRRRRERLRRVAAAKSAKNETEF